MIKVTLTIECDKWDVDEFLGNTPQMPIEDSLKELLEDAPILSLKVISVEELI